MRKKDLQKLIKNPDSYDELAIWGSDANEFLPADEKEEVEAQENERPAQAPQQEGGFLNSVKSLFSGKPEQATSTQAELVTSKAAPDKVKFDKSNPAHVKRAHQVLESAKGDKAAANQALSQEFSL